MSTKGACWSEIYCKYRAVGEYLQSHELPEMLTWQAIHEALPKARKRGQRGRAKVHFIRSGLLELGNHFLPEQLVPYQRERRLEKWLRSAPVMFVEHVTAFEKWAIERDVESEARHKPA